MPASPHIPPLQLAARSAAGAGIAVAVANLLELQYPLYAMIGAVIVTDLSPAQTRQLASKRLAGTVVGAIVGAACSSLLPQGAPIIAAGIFAAMFLSHLFRLKTAATIAGYVCGIVILDHSMHPWAYALHRLVETVLGIGVAIAVSFVPKLLRTEQHE
jgi:uncharacterized membrane protein YgaE (UPF0421/DUF939 family)